MPANPAPETADVLYETVAKRLGDALPAVELFDLKVSSGAVMKVFIDHPDGVSHEHCSAVVAALDDLRESYSLEVSSPGLPRPLSRPQHFAAALGREVELTLYDPLESGQRRFTGTITKADTTRVELDLGEAKCQIELAAIKRAHIVQELVFGRPRKK